MPKANFQVFTNSLATCQSKYFTTSSDIFSEVFFVCVALLPRTMQFTLVSLLLTLLMSRHRFSGNMLAHTEAFNQ